MKYKNLPEGFSWLEKETGPLEVLEALRHLGTLEVIGKGSNPNIMRWAVEVGVSGWYPDDDVPWCGLFKGICAKRTGWLPTPKYDLLSALSWLVWGVPVLKQHAAFGDTLIFSRNGGGHVAYYIGEDDTHYYILGGNQSNSVTITRRDKTTLMGVRRAKWKNSQPLGVRKIYLKAGGIPISKNEA